MTNHADALAAFSSSFGAIADQYREARTATGVQFPPNGVYTVMLTKIDVETTKFNHTEQKDGPSSPCLSITPHYQITDHADAAISGMQFTHPSFRIVGINAADFKKLPENKQTACRIALEQLKGFYKKVTGGQDPTGSPQADIKTLLDMLVLAEQNNTAIQLEVTCKTSERKGTGRNSDKTYTNRDVYINRLVQGVDVPAAS
jgi:hypothetical protein